MLVRIAIEKQLLPSEGSVIKMNPLCCRWQSFKMFRSTPFDWFDTLEHVQEQVTDACKGDWGAACL